MAGERLPMRQLREILRLRLVQGLSHRKAAESLGVAVGSVWHVEHRAKELGLGVEALEKLSDSDLDTLMYPSAAATRSAPRAAPDFVRIHTELRRVGVTLELLHLEYLESHRGGYGYSRFCELYGAWRKKGAPTMRQVHRAGEKMFVDYSGKKPHIVDPVTGERTEVELFVAVLGASNYTFAEATRTQGGVDFVQSHIRAFEFFGGVTALTVPDQLRSAVSRPCRYEPGLSRIYGEMACHYGTAVLPARPRHARDKAKVEVGVQVAQRWLLARLRHETFHSVEALNARLSEMLVDLDARVMKAYGASRRDLFERLDRPALRPLPPERFTYGEWRHARVNIDYHVEVHGHFYSVPHPLLHEEVEARVTATTVEVFHRGDRVASHARGFARGFTTKPEHMPAAHREHLEWSPSRMLRWAAKVGPNTEALVGAIIAERRHPEQGYRSCLGILRLGRRHGDVRLEAACARALAAGARSFRHVDSILKHGLDRVPFDAGVADTDPSNVPAPRLHENLRGRDYYH